MRLGPQSAMFSERQAALSPTVMPDNTAKPKHTPTTEPSSTLAPDGSLIRVGHYDIEGAIGSGGMGVVYRAIDRRSARVVALKAMRVASDDEGQRQRRFEK
ncbi:MAG: hypothetical protein PF961_18300 [Planctomycetota bacterium]|jgi:serine/threonine protein kinase|nr:hypothetical protein [Planctomycetota bacterium]